MAFFTLEKEIEISSGHQLKLPYDSKCQNYHGHNWKVTVRVEGEHLTPYGMLVDFCHIKDVVMQLDHANLNEKLDINPTAEQIAEWIATEIQIRINREWKNYPFQEEDYPQVVQVEIEESEGNRIVYTCGAF